MKRDENRRVDPLALLVFYGAIAAVGLLVGFLVSLLLLPSNTGARLALMLGSVMLAALAINRSLDWLMTWTSRRAARLDACRGETRGRFSRLIDHLSPLIEAAVRVGHQGQQPR